MSTSAGRTSESSRSIAIDALDGLGREPLAGAQHGEQLADDAVDERDLGGGHR